MRSRVRAWPALWLAVFASSATAQAYVDKVLEEGPQPQLRLEREVDTSGWARGWRVEATEATDTGSQASRIRGLGVSGFIDTPDYGAISVSSNLSQSSQQQSTSLWRVEQAGLQLDGGWRADHGVGDLVSPLLSMARSGGRIGLPSNPLRGASAVYAQANDTRLVAALGQPGVYSGLNINGFETAPGSLAFLGGERNWAGGGSESSVALQYAGARGVANALHAAGTESSDSLWSAWRWRARAPWAEPTERTPVVLGSPRLRDGELELQVNTLGSALQSNAADGASGDHPRPVLGAWTDARWRSGILEQNAGLFHLPAGLRWGSYPAVADLRGGYWSADLSQRQWQLASNVEWTDSSSGQGPGSTLVTTTARRRLDTRNTVSAILAIRERGAAGQSTELTWDNRNSWGQTQWRIDMLRSGARQARRAGVDHAMLFESGSSLTASISVERNEELGLTSRLYGWGILGAVRPLSAVTLDASIRGVEGSAGQRQLNGNVGLGWRVNTNWTMLAQYSVNRGEDPSTLALVSALVPAVQTPTSLHYERLQVTLRYEERAGQSVAPLGGSPGSGAGRLAGTVFFDADRNGRRDASEAGAADIAVRLDGRFIARTDSQGRFEFPFVVAGTHTVEVVPDNIPLPWGLSEGAPQRVEVLVRGLSSVEFALVREQ